MPKKPRSDCEYKHRPSRKLSKRRFKKQEKQATSASERIYASSADREKQEAINGDHETIPITKPGFSRTMHEEPAPVLPIDHEGQRRYLREKRGLPCCS